MRVPGVLGQNKPPAMKKKTKKTAEKYAWNGRTYKSYLEIHCAKLLEQHGLTNDYEGVKFTLVPAFTCPNDCLEFCFKKDKATKVRKKHFLPASKKIQQMIYTPDFCDLKAGWIIECKGYKNESFPLRLKLFKKYLVDNNLGHVTFYMPNDNAQVEETIAHILTTYGTHHKTK